MLVKKSKKKTLRAHEESTWTKLCRYKPSRATLTFLRRPDVPGFIPSKGVVGRVLILVAEAAAAAAAAAAVAVPPRTLIVLLMLETDDDDGDAPQG